MAGAPVPVGVVLAPEPADRAQAFRASYAVGGHDLPLLVGDADLPRRDPSAPILSLWRTHACEVYVCVDPRVEFLRPLRATDVLARPGVPFTVASEEAERWVAGPDPLAPARAAARRELGVTDRRRLVTRGLGVVSATALESFQREVVDPRGGDLAPLLAICPDEFAWYTAWLLARSPADVELREPLVAMQDTVARRQDAAVNRETDADLARGYVGVVRDGGGHPADRADVLAETMTTGELMNALVRRSTRKAPRVQGWLGLDRPY